MHYYAIMKRMSVILFLMIFLIVVCNVFLSACIAKDPIIGVWKYYDKTEDIEVKIQFKDDGRFIMAVDDLVQGETYMDLGSWSKLSGNSYKLYFDTPQQGDSDYDTYIYDASGNVIYNPDYPNELFTRYQGDIV